jgi:DNA phosphorothioation-dependent restriction protein DptH
MEILAQFAKDDSKNKNATQTVSSKIKPFVLDKPFDFGREGLDWQALFTDAVNRCHVFQLAGLDMHSWRLVTEFVLWDLYGYLQAKGRKNDPKVIVLDEVQNLDHRDGSPLSRYLREGRKFGLSLIMATQIMSSLEKDERDRMFNAGHKLFFRPADTEMRAYADIAAISTAEKPEIWVKRLAGLKKGECYSLGPSLNEATGKLEAKAFHIKITSLEDRGTHA